MIKAIKPIPPRISFLINLFLIYLTFFVAQRIVFYFWFISSEELEILQILKGWYIGIKFDARLAMIIASIIWLFDLIIQKVFLKWRAKSFYIINSLFLLCVYQIYFFDYGFYSYLGDRISAAALKFLENPLISFQMVWESYPVIWGTIAFLVLMIISLALLSSKTLDKEIKQRTIQYTSFEKIFLGVLTFVCWVGIIYGKFSYFPLRWSDAYFSTSRALSQFNLNPVFNFFETMAFKDQAFNLEKIERAFPLFAKYFDFPTMEFKGRESLIRTYPKKKSLYFDESNLPNIVVIILESMASNKSSMLNPLNPTPVLQQLAQEGIYFNRFYTPTEATARAVFAFITGIPDVTSIKTSSRNPLIVNQQSVLNEFKNYKKLYFLGGSANWGNIRGVVAHNIDKVEIFEEGRFSNQAQRVDVWGISDLDLMMEAHNIFQQQDSQFFGIIQTAGFHRPYTIPEGAKAFEPKLIAKKKLQDNSFHSLEEYNSLRFQDYALGEFLKVAKKGKYFENTLFVIFGDHGLGVQKSNNVPESFKELRIVNHHVPLIFYSPKYIKTPVEDATIASQLDVLPSIASMVGIPYRNTTLGRDLFSIPEKVTAPFAFLFSWNYQPRMISLIQEDYIYIDRPEQQALYYYDRMPLIDQAASKPQLFEEMKVMTQGLYHLSKWLLNNNKKLK